MKFFPHLDGCERIWGEEESLVMEEVDLKPPSSITKPMENEARSGRTGMLDIVRPVVCVHMTTSLYNKADTAKKAEMIKQVVTIPLLAEKLYPGWEFTVGRACHSPWRTDTHTSFYISPDGMLWHDKGSGKGGNVFHFYMASIGCDKRQAFKDLLAMAGGDNISSSPIAQAAPGAQEKKPQHHPSLETPAVEELTAISKLRSIKPEALQLAADQGFLFTATLKNLPAFILTDQTRKCYLARKMDGTDWEHNGCKAYTLSGSQASWPIGILESTLYPAIALTEGVPDFLSAFHLALAFGVDPVVAPVCMSGASVSIPGDALPHIVGKRIRIFAHNDAAGQAAAQRWTEQLEDTATVDCFTFGGLEMSDGKVVKDLNDLLRISGDSYRGNAKRIDGVMRF
jgi:hypothetical protein